MQNSSGLIHRSIRNRIHIRETNGNAQTGIYYSDTTTALPFRIVDLVPDTSYVSSGNVVYPEVIVKFNFGYQSYNNVLGK